MGMDLPILAFLVSVAEPKARPPRNDILGP